MATTTAKKFVKFIVTGWKNHCGYWGRGDTLEEAMKEYKRAGGTVKGIAAKYKFTAELPWAPSDREATDGESDCYMDRSGCLNWVRCEREELGI